ncbi:MAG TPA: caspase family protein [Kofleriaceae bacterium]|nr:caspase family protein [Kofleriaceae bacterium]
MRLALVVLGFLAVAHSTAFAEQRYAILIGSNPGWSSDRPLRYAENDAERMRDVLVALGGFSTDRVALLRDPDTSEVRATLRDVARTVQSSSEDTLVFVYYSGHADDERLHLKGDPLTFKELHATIRSLPATLKLAVIDACKSGAVTRKGGSRVDEFAVSVDSPKLSGMVILTSSGADELSQESRALAGSVFTHHLVSGLRGAADTNKDNQVTLAEAYQYAYARTRADTAVTGTPQRPSFKYEITGQGELVLAQLKATKVAQMTLPKGDTKYVVLDAHEWRLIAEAQAEKDREIILALAPGSYKIKKVYADRLEVGSLVVNAGDKAGLDKLAYTSAPISQGIVKGSPDDLSPEDHHEWQRTQAFGLLSAGQASAALNLFDQLLRDVPDDMQAWRGRARALVRLAEAYQRVNDTMHERLTLNDALKADPSLTQDPNFTLWYQRLGEIDARNQMTWEQKQKLQQQVRDNPRTEKTFGLGFDLISARGLFTMRGSLAIKHMFFPHVALDIGSQGFDGGIVFAPLAKRWSPFLGIGGHVSFKKLGIDFGGGGEGMVMVNDESYTTEELYGLHARAEIGAQYVGRSGFTTELGLALIGFNKADGTRKTTGWPIFHFGWVW